MPIIHLKNKENSKYRGESQISVCRDHARNNLLYTRFTKAFCKSLLLLIAISSWLPRPHQITCTHKNKKPSLKFHDWFIYSFMMKPSTSMSRCFWPTYYDDLDECTKEGKKLNKITWTWHTDSVAIAFYHQLHWKLGTEDYTNNKTHKIIRSPLQVWESDTVWIWQEEAVDRYSALESQQS